MVLRFLEANSPLGEGSNSRSESPPGSSKTTNTGQDDRDDDDDKEDESDEKEGEELEGEEPEDKGSSGGRISSPGRRRVQPSRQARNKERPTAQLSQKPTRTYNPVGLKITPTILRCHCQIATTPMMFLVWYYAFWKQAYRPHRRN